MADSILGYRKPAPEPTGIHTETTDSHQTEWYLAVDGARSPVPADGVVLGRQPGSTGIVVPDVRVSRRHVRIERTDLGISVADLGSMNGTVVVRDDERLEVRSEVLPLRNGDCIMTMQNVLLADVIMEKQSVSLS